MKLLDELDREHELIDRVAGSMLAWSRVEQAPAAELDGYLRFFRVFVRGYHHLREEEILFTTLVEQAEVPGDRGPLAILEREHRDLERLLQAVEAARPAERAAVVRALVHHVWEHLDKERSVLLPEARKRLQRSAIRQLDGPDPGPEQVLARSTGEALVAARRPADDLEIVRGDGCICCAAFATECHGIEAEWWSDHEWRHYRSLDEG